MFGRLIEMFITWARERNPHSKFPSWGGRLDGWGCDDD